MVYFKLNGIKPTKTDGKYIFMENIFHQQGSNSHPEGLRHCSFYVAGRVLNTRPRKLREWAQTPLRNTIQKHHSACLLRRAMSPSTKWD